MDVVHHVVGQVQVGEVRAGFEGGQDVVEVFAQSVVGQIQFGQGSVFFEAPDVLVEGVLVVFLVDAFNHRAEGQLDIPCAGAL